LRTHTDQAITTEGLNNNSYHSGAYDQRECFLTPLVKQTRSASFAEAFSLDPNVILIHVGTNDCWYVKGENGTGANIQMGYLLDSIREKAPDALVMASTLIRNTNDWANRCIKGVNAGLPATVAAAVAKGQEVKLVDMYPIVPADQIQSDGTHPTDYGYQLMARQWYEGILNATNDVCIQQRVAAAASATGTAAGSSTNPSATASPLESGSSSSSAGASSMIPDFFASLAAFMVLMVYVH
jgi:lysophospholipase L1-like esterase